jgi:hypothetical protein
VPYTSNLGYHHSLQRVYWNPKSKLTDILKNDSSHSKVVGIHGLK